MKPLLFAAIKLRRLLLVLSVALTTGCGTTVFPKAETVDAANRNVENLSKLQVGISRPEVLLIMGPRTQRGDIHITLNTSTIGCTSLVAEEFWTRAIASAATHCSPSKVTRLEAGEKTMKLSPLAGTIRFARSYIRMPMLTTVHQLSQGRSWQSNQAQQIDIGTAPASHLFLAWSLNSNAQ